MGVCGVCGGCGCGCVQHLRGEAVAPGGTVQGHSAAWPSTPLVGDSGGTRLEPPPAERAMGRAPCLRSALGCHAAPGEQGAIPGSEATPAEAEGGGGAISDSPLFV